MGCTACACPTSKSRHERRCISNLFHCITRRILSGISQFSESRSWAGILTFNPLCPCRSISAPIKIRFSRFSTSIQNNSCFLKKLSRFLWTASLELPFWRSSPQYRHAYERVEEMCFLTRSSSPGTSLSNTNDDSRLQILNRSCAFITSKQPFASSSWC